MSDEESSQPLIRVLARPEDLLQKAAVFFRVVAGICRRCAVKERDIGIVGASGVAEQIADLINAYNLHALGRREYVGV